MNFQAHGVNQKWKPLKLIPFIQTDLCLDSMKDFIIMSCVHYSNKLFLIKD